MTMGLHVALVVTLLLRRHQYKKTRGFWALQTTTSKMNLKLEQNKTRQVRSLRHFRKNPNQTTKQQTSKKTCCETSSCSRKPRQQASKNKTTHPRRRQTHVPPNYSGFFILLHNALQACAKTQAHALWDTGSPSSPNPTITPRIPDDMKEP